MNSEKFVIIANMEWCHSFSAQTGHFMKEMCTFKFGLVEQLHEIHGNSTANCPNEDEEIRTLNLTNDRYKDGLKYNNF